MDFYIGLFGDISIQGKIDTAISRRDYIFQNIGMKLDETLSRESPP
jgi:hypothetical protein